MRNRNRINNIKNLILLSLLLLTAVNAIFYWTLATRLTPLNLIGIVSRAGLSNFWIQAGHDLEQPITKADPSLVVLVTGLVITVVLFTVLWVLNKKKPDDDGAPSAPRDEAPEPGDGGGGGGLPPAPPAPPAVVDLPPGEQIPPEEDLPSPPQSPEGPLNWITYRPGDELYDALEPVPNLVETYYPDLIFIWVF